MSKRVLAFLLIMAAFSSSSALAADPENSLESYDLRMGFVESRLDESHQHARYWQNGWSTFYAGSALVQTILWIDADKNDDSVNYGIGALKSVGGLADMLLRPHPGRQGAAPLLGWQQEHPEQRDKKLQFAETLLQDSAARAASRHQWQPHIKVIGVNLVAGALIAAFGDSGDALTSTAVGIAVGEANIWTQPTRPEVDLQDYRQAFPRTAGLNKPGWRLVPMAAGIAIKGWF